MTAEIKPKAICVFRNRDFILVSEYNDPLTGKPFYRPIGGRIDFGENSEQALIREIQEELGAEIVNVRHLGVLENIYHHKNKLSHELMFIYDADFVDQSYYLRPVIEGYEYTDNRKFTIYWKPLSEFLSGESILYPSGLLDMLIEDSLVEIPAGIKEQVIEDLAV